MPEQFVFPARKFRRNARASRRAANLRRQRLEQLRHGLQRGTYRVSALQIAAAMLREGVGGELSAA